MTTETKTEYGYEFSDGEVWGGYDDIDKIVAEIDPNRELSMYAGRYVRRTVTITTTGWETVSIRENAEPTPAGRLVATVTERGDEYVRNEIRQRRTSPGADT